MPMLRMTPGQRGCPLSSKEKAALTLAAEGLSNCEIAVRLGISECAAKHRLERAMAKLQAPNRTKAVCVAISRGWIRLRQVDDIPGHEVKN